MKRAADLLLSVGAMIALIPLFIVVGILIKLDGPGPILFRSVRIGKGGTPFGLLKFRTMVIDAQKLSTVVSTPSDDPRITRIGKVLRKYCIDELPQLINVIRGEMSIIGPRPEVPQYVAMFTEEQRQILSVLPGLSDWATLWVGDKGVRLRGNADPEKFYMEHIRPEKLRLQLKYVREGNLLADAEIIAKTIILVAKKIAQRT